MTSQANFIGSDHNSSTPLTPLTTMTPETALALNTINSIIMDLSCQLDSKTRYQRLLAVWQSSFAGDACVLLQLFDDCLIPRAAIGLHPSIMGRHFRIDEHPRLALILQDQAPVRFDADCSLPDPYDGLIQGTNAGLPIHDCMGTVLVIDNKPWGIITMDALNPQTFENIAAPLLQTLTGLTTAVIRVAETLSKLADQAHYQRQITATLIKEQQHEILSNSDIMLSLKKEISLVAQSDLTTLVLGESGVGKELVARSIHQQSSRAEHPIVTVNCAALPESLVESELFGHIKGAFTGATKDRLGKFELANKGTLFLDEVGELPLSIQSRLLRVLQSGELERLGSDDHHSVDVRIVAATNRDLKLEVQQGRFRADLYHRLSVYPLHVPPLRERSEDILLLSGFFLSRLQRQLGVNNISLSNASDSWLLEYTWPGNVRELEHLLSRASLKALGRNDRRKRTLILLPEDLGLPTASKPTDNLSRAMTIAGGIDHNLPLKLATDAFQRQYIQHCLDAKKGNLAGAAKALGLDRSNFQRLLKRLGLR